MAVALAVVVIVLGQFAASLTATRLTACAIWPVMFGSGFRIGITTVTMVPQLMVQLGNHLQTLTGLVAAVTGSSTPGACGQLIATSSIRSAATTTLASASPGIRCKTVKSWE